MRICDWSSDVCSSDLRTRPAGGDPAAGPRGVVQRRRRRPGDTLACRRRGGADRMAGTADRLRPADRRVAGVAERGREHPAVAAPARAAGLGAGGRSEEHTSELQSLMRISYAVFCLKKKNNETK